MWLLLACVPMELKETADLSEEALPQDLQISFDAVIQQNNWGSGLGRCEVQATFLKVGQSDGMWEGPGQLWDPLLLPEGHGSCAVTLRDPDQMEEALAAQAPPEDNWELEGRLEAGSRLLLEGRERNVELLPTYDEDGLFVNYSMADCSEESFPFGEAFSLVVEEGSEEIPPFRLENALAVGPKMELLGLGDAEEVLSQNLYQDEDYMLAWAFEGGVGEIDHELEHRIWLTVRNDEREGIQEFEAIVCLADPEDGSLATSFSIPSEQLSELTPNPSPGGPYVVGVQIDSRTTGPERELPWGQRIRIQSTVSLDGKGELLESR